MLRKISAVFFLVCSGAFSSPAPPDWEALVNYDPSLEIVFRQLDRLVDNKLPDCRGLGECYALGDEVLVINSPAYTYFLEDASIRTVRIRAENKFGGRTYIYDYEWNVTHYVFQTFQEAQKIGETLIEWLTIEEKPYDGSEWVWISITLGYRGCYADKLYKDNGLDILGCFGDFLVYEKLRDKVWAIVLGGRVFGDEEGREKCVRSILSNYDQYPQELQKEVLEKVAKYLETADDEKTRYSKKIAEFVLEKGGRVPERSYWDYDTRRIPYVGGKRAYREGSSKAVASLISTNISTEKIMGKLPAERIGIESEADKLLRQREQLLKIRNKILLGGWYTDKQDAVNDVELLQALATNTPPRGAEGGGGSESSDP